MKREEEDKEDECTPCMTGGFLTLHVERVAPKATSWPYQHVFLRRIIWLS